MARLRPALALFLLMVALMPRPVLAWGLEGHAIIATIAEDRLTPEAAMAVRALLDRDHAQHLADIASWADMIRLDQPETQSWHFVNIDAGQIYDPAQNCAGGDCVIEQLADHAALLARSDTDAATRLVALKWVVHLVGDLHQPLHCGHSADLGGNRIPVRFFGDTHHQNLHRIWDSGLLVRAYDLPHPQGPASLAASIAIGHRFSAALTQARGPDLDPAALTPAIIGWAMASHDLAERIAYGKLPADGVIDSAYSDDAMPVIENQLKIAGIRLAAILNRALPPR